MALISTQDLGNMFIKWASGFKYTKNAFDVHNYQSFIQWPLSVANSIIIQPRYYGYLKHAPHALMPKLVSLVTQLL